MPEDCVSLTVQVKREGITDKNGFTISKPSTSTLSVRIKEYESEPETETESESEDPSESESESESENESESETPPEPEPLAAPELFVSDKKQEFLYIVPLFYSASSYRADETPVFVLLTKYSVASKLSAS